MIQVKEQIKIEGGKTFTVFVPIDEKSSKNLFDDIVTEGTPPHLYEHITPDSKQKPRFDIDISEKMDEEESDLYVKRVLVEIVLIVKSYGARIDFDDLYVYSSHSPGGEKKSYHIIVNKIYHNNNREAKRLYIDVLESLVGKGYDRKEDPFLDSAVYKTAQLFRLPLCSKLGHEDRPKKLIKKFSSDGLEIEKIADTYDDQLDVFRKSLVTYCENCSHIPIEVPEIKKSQNISGDDRRLFPAVNLVRDLYGDSLEYSHVSGAFCIFRNKYGVDCPVCNRVHKSENPYLFFAEYDRLRESTVWNVFFSCRRSNDKKENIGIVTDWGLYISFDRRMMKKTLPKEVFQEKLDKLLAKNRRICVLESLRKHLSDRCLEETENLKLKWDDMKRKNKKIEYTVTLKKNSKNDMMFNITTQDYSVDDIPLQAGNIESDIQIVKSIFSGWCKKLSRKK